jgi:hypothetical protein
MTVVFFFLFLSFVPAAHFLQGKSVYLLQGVVATRGLPWHVAAIHPFAVLLTYLSRHPLFLTHGLGHCCSVVLRCSQAGLLLCYGDSFALWMVGHFPLEISSLLLKANILYQLFNIFLLLPVFWLFAMRVTVPCGRWSKVCQDNSWTPIEHKPCKWCLLQHHFLTTSACS